MAGRPVPLRIGDVEVLVTTVPVPGTEATSRQEQPGEWMRDAFDRAQAAVVGVAEATATLKVKLTYDAASAD